MRSLNLKSTVNVVDSFCFDRFNSVGSGVAYLLCSHFLPLLRSFTRAYRQPGAVQRQVSLAVPVAVTTGRGRVRPVTAMPAITAGPMWPVTG